MRSDRTEALALTDGERSWTYRELTAAAAEFGRTLPGASGTVVLVLGSTVEGVVALHAVWDTGAVVAPLNPRLTEVELAEALGALDPVAIVTSRDHERRVMAAAASTGVTFETRLEAPGGLVVAANAGAPAPRGSKDPCAVLWTSGTSGRPRGVLLSGAALRHSAEATRARLDLGPKDRWYVSLSFAHVGGLALVSRAAFLGSVVVATGATDIGDLSDRIDAGTVTHASLVPVVLQRLVEHRGGRPPPATLRCLLIGGGPAHRPLLNHALEEGYPVALTYGLTEATSQVATAEPALVRRKPGTVGAPLAGVEVRVATDGEILVRGPTLAVGALGGAALAVDADGWLHTGDLGELDDEGHLWITGRRSDRIVTGGFTVDPAEVVAVLESHASVREAAVLGVPDPEWGERVVAVVVMTGPGGGDLAGLEALCRARLTSAKVPRRWMVLDTLPRNANGKVDREALVRLVGGEGGG